MPLNNIFSKLFSKEDKVNGYKWDADTEGVNFFVSPETTSKIYEGSAELWVTNQHIALRMLVEQGDAEPIPNGFIVPSDVMVNLDTMTRELLTMPRVWDGALKADIKGNTRKSSFAINLMANDLGSEYTNSYKLDGPILKFSSEQIYTLTAEQNKIFKAVNHHRLSNKDEYSNLKVVYELQEAQNNGADINLSHFEKLDIKSPASISVEAEFDDDGNLLLSPYMGQDASHEKIQKVLGQLKSDSAKALRVGTEIVLFDEKKLTAVHEIIKNRVVPKNKVKQFLDKPTAFIDASLVDLDVGFSIRVHGAVKFKHAYFGETDESGIDWFGTGELDKSSSLLPISKLGSSIEDEDKLDDFKNKLDDAYKVGAVEICFEGQYFDISDKESVTKIIDSISNKINGELPDSEYEETSIDVEKDEPEIAVVDVDLNDEELEVSSPSLDETISNILYPKEKLDWSNYLRKPYAHQEYGVRWILGLALSENKIPGALLADDMGLGKTFMALSAADQIYKTQGSNGSIKKPCLVVAPLSLLQNWKDEITETFSDSPFKDIVILQSDADLTRFKVGGVETKQQDLDENSEAGINYSLKIGNTYFDERLDLPQRLVITTYQTLRDYMFSLCSIDWGLVICDEAQNIKNFNTLQSRAAKGLKSDFKLLATGTPVENSLADFWCLMEIAYLGYLGEYQDFRQKYVLPILQAAGDEVEEVRARIGRELRLKVGPLMLRRVKEDHLDGLPDKNIFVGINDGDLHGWNYLNALESQMSSVQLNTYNSTLTIQAESEENIVLTGLQRLRDVSLHPQLADGGQLKVSKSKSELNSLMNESGKMLSILNLLSSIKDKGEKCIIFVINKRLQHFLSLALGQKYGLGIIPIVNGDTKAVSKKSTTPTRKSIIKAFEDRKGFNIIIMSPVAAGVGLTIVGANNVIHLERHWNPAKEAQATDRVYRIGQKKNVNVYVPILHHPEYESFDVNLHYLLSKKTQLKDAVVTPEQVVPNPGGFGNESESNYRITSGDLHRLSWQQFEALCADLYLKENNAQSSHLTQAGSDGGADAVTVTGKTIQLIQSKHTSGAKYDGYKAIQEVSSARVIYEKELDKKADKLIFVTNAKILSSRAKTYAKEYNVEIVSFKQLDFLLEKHEITYEMILKTLGKKRLKIS